MPKEVDAHNNRVQKFTSGGEFLTLWPKGDGNFAQAHFNVSSGIAADKPGHVGVANFFGSRLEVFTADGKPLSVFGGKRPKPNGFKWPIDLAFDGDGTLYVVDYGNSRIQKYRNPQPVAIPIKTAARVDSPTTSSPPASTVGNPLPRSRGAPTARFALGGSLPEGQAGRTSPLHRPPAALFLG